MNRVRAEALALVNWRGVFYERYELDPHVTVLEGNNGAGKTTVMIAAYVVLLPDMTRLRFTNLGETGATGGDKGIWGRLGEPGRPSYAAIDFRLPRGERVLAGVHLERKGEPTVEPTPFLVTGLADDVRLQDLLLLTQGDLELVPELQELKDNAGRLGARVQTFPTAREYFAALFEQGITPMRMGTDQERNKLNEMLKTSMTGGMSRGLLHDLRSFLLKQEGGLAETLQRMRANLDACRRTRTEVLESQRLEEEIRSVYEAGEEMFAAAVAATRQRAEEMTRRVSEKEADRVEAEAAASRAETGLEEANRSVEGARLAKGEAAASAENAATWQERASDALRWRRKLHERKEDLARAISERDDARRAREEADRELQRAVDGLSSANEDRELAAAGLADLQKGLEELHRRAAAHRKAGQELDRARRSLDLPGLDPRDRAEIDATARADLDDIDRGRRGLARRIADAATHRREHRKAVASLRTILGAGADADRGIDLARDALETVQKWESAARGRSELRRQLTNATDQAERQTAARAEARHLALEWPLGGGRAAVEAAVNETDLRIDSASRRAQRAEAAADEAAREARTVRTEIQALEARATPWKQLTALAGRMQAHLGPPLDGREDLSRGRSTLGRQREEAGRELREVRSLREALLEEAGQLLNAGGGFPEALLRLRDELTAELLASHFDDVGTEEAAELEAKLGPLAEALVVEDLEAATRRLAGRDSSLATVWLVPEDAALGLDPDQVIARAGERDVVVDEGVTRRVTRIPDRPTLGRAAREERATELRREAQELEPRVEALARSVRTLESLQAAADDLLAGIATWVLGDPAAELNQGRVAAASALRRQQSASTEATEAKTEVAQWTGRRRALRDLLGDAALLDAPDQRERERDLRSQLEEADRADAELRRVGEAPAVLRRRQDALRHEPWSEADVLSARERLDSLIARRDALADGLEALAYVVAHAHALGWTDAAVELEQQQGLVPALDAQLTRAKEAVAEARSHEQRAREARDAATEKFNQAHARHATADEQAGQAAARLSELGIEEPTDSLLREANARLVEARSRQERAELRLGELRTEVGRREAASTTTAEAADRARQAEEDERKQARPAQEGWERLRPQVEDAQLLESALSEPFLALFGGRGSVNLFPHAQSRGDFLLERLGSAQGGAGVLEEARRLLDQDDQTFGERFLHAWLLVRDWLRSRLPAQISEVDEPLEALGRFRDHLSGLVDRLERQEKELRGASEDVARGIDVQIRKANGRVKRLNQHLHGVAFGSIGGIKVRMKRVERMEQVLRALRSGEAQELLFQVGIPVEEALQEIFRRFGGGRTGGQRLLDYREYILLHVEVLRAGRQAWEPANPTRLSTGEAIGVGAALMMVVLTEWERDANLLRGKRSFGSMRFLFLDEANRLDQANLGTVFDLCRTLDLQLLVAAPEVARAEGCTVFRLVRTGTEEGEERVLVSGRRVVAGA